MTCLFHRKHDVAARLAAYDARNVASTGCIIRQHDIAGAEAALGPVAEFDLSLAGKRDDILAPRRRMPVLDVAGRSVTKDDTLARLDLPDLHLDLFEVRLAVFSGIKSRNLHDSALVDKLRRKSKLIFLPGSASEVL